MVDLELLVVDLEPLVGLQLLSQLLTRGLGRLQHQPHVVVVLPVLLRLLMRHHLQRQLLRRHRHQHLVQRPRLLQHLRLLLQRRLLRLHLL